MKDIIRSAAADKRFLLRIPESLFLNLKVLARENSRSVNEEIRARLERSVKREQEEMAPSAKMSFWKGIRELGFRRFLGDRWIACDKTGCRITLRNDTLVDLMTTWGPSVALEQIRKVLDGPCTQVVE